MVIRLITMPFGHLALPSLALTQLKSVLLDAFGSQVDIEILYLNMDLARDNSMAALYDHVLSNRGMLTGIGDWLFRQAAFPSAPDNDDAYLERYYFDDDAESLAVRHYVRGPRRQLPEVLDALIRQYGLDRADMVGFTSLFAQTLPSAALAQRNKQANPSVTTLLGGAACEGLVGQELARQLDAIDFVCNGPGLTVLPRLVRHIMEQPGAPDCDIAGICTSRTVPTPHADPVYDHAWERLPPPDFTDFLAALDHHDQARAIPPALLFQTSEGCWWGDRSTCAFCGLNAAACLSHAMPPRDAVALIAALLKQAGARPFLMAVDSIMPRTYPHDVFTRIGTPSDGCIQYEVRPTLSAREIGILAKAGVRLLQPGIEALSTSTLQLMRKGLTAFQNLRFLKDCSRHPITLRWNLLLFSPGEHESTYDDYLRLLPRLTHLHPPEGAFPVNYVRNSRYLADPERFGLKLEPQDFYGLTYPCEMEALQNLANVFTDRNADPDFQDRWLHRLNAHIRAWQALYFADGDHVQARLMLFEEGGRPGIYDSRDGTEQRYWIEDAAQDVLLYLEHPHRREEIAKTFPGVPPVLQALSERGLLFEEDGYLMSLVMPHRYDMSAAETHHPSG